MYSKSIKWILLLLTFMLAACGGGGSSLGFSLSTGTLNFDAASSSSSTPSPKSFTTTVSGGAVYLAVFFNGTALDNVTLSLSGSTGTVTAYPKSPSSLGGGIHTDTITVIGCADPNCNSEVSGSPKEVSVTYSIGGLTASPTTVNLSSLVNLPSSSAQSTISSPSGSGSWTSNISYVGNTTNWLTLNPLSGSSLPQVIDFSASSVPVAGTYTANVTISSGQNSVTIPVTYVVNDTLTPSTTSLSYTINDNPSAAELTRQFSPGATTGVTWTAAADVSWLTLSPTTGGPGDIVTADIDQNAISAFSNGTYTGTVTLTPSTGTVKTVAVDMTIDRTPLIVTPTSVSLSSAETLPSSAVQATVSSLTGLTSWSSSISYVGNTTNWLTLSPVSGSSLPQTIDFSASGLATPGTYSANVTFSSGQDTLVIPVTYVVSAALTPSPTSLSYTINDNPSTADLTRQISTGATTGVTWTAAADVSWLTLSPATGGPGDTITADIDQNALSTLNNGTYTGTVTLTPSTGSLKTVAVDLTITRAQVNFVAPYVAAPSVAADVIIRGENFDQNSIQSVSFGTTPATSYSFISSTEIHATHPILLPGNYAVNVNTGTNVRTLATLSVVNQPTYSSATIAYPNTVSKTPVDIVYDAERQALVVGVGYPSPGASSADVFRYAYSAGAWSANPDTTFIAGLRDIGLSTDGQQVLAVSNYAINELDPVTLSAGTVTAAPFTSRYYLKNIEFTNAGDGLVTTGINGSGYTNFHRYKLRQPVITRFGFSSFYFGSPGISGDGSHATIVQGSLSPAPSVYQYLASTDVLSTAGISLNQNSSMPPKLDRTGNRILLNGYLVYDSGYQQLGNLPTTGTPAAAVLSPDGGRAYVYHSGSVLRTYDLTATPVAGVFPEIGTGIILPSDPGSAAKMTVSPDGKTAFIAGSLGIVVVPTP